MQSCGDLVMVSKVKIHREFLGGDVAGFVGRKGRIGLNFKGLRFSRNNLDIITSTS